MNRLRKAVRDYRKRLVNPSFGGEGGYQILVA